MSDLGEDRRSLVGDMTLMMNEMVAVMHLPVEHPRFLAWVAWKDALIAQLRVLERREAELQSEPTLWISQAPGDRVGVS